MRTATCLVLILFASTLALAKPKAKPKATLTCTTASGVKLPAKGKPRISGTITCLVTVSSAGTFMTTVSTRSGKTKGPNHSGDAFKGTPLKAELAEGTDYNICSNFLIEAQIESDTSDVLWKKKLDIKQDCPD
jgi:hypothetical protein